MSSPLDLTALRPQRPLVRADDPPGLVSSLRTLARAMLSLTEDGGEGEARNGDRREWGRLARSLHRERERRAEFFAADLFGEPAWDILLDLYAAAKAGELRSIKSACLSSHAPEATALRYIEQLVGHGLVERKPDRTDKRRKYLSLTPLGERKMPGLPRLDAAARRHRRGPRALSGAVLLGRSPRSTSLDLLRRNIKSAHGPRGPNAARALCEESLHD